jgi:hypothetical protein
MEIQKVDQKDLRKIQTKILKKKNYEVKLNFFIIFFSKNIFF